ncbi:MAG TPA: hypothetical protein VNN10_07730 [Dehalococcoidia bacterium]|nr:hypothetical protein [Dehalococcoidia bacterium]
MSEQETPGAPRRWQRREQRHLAARRRMQKHGAGVKRVYADALRKRLKRRRPDA